MSEAFVYEGLRTAVGAHGGGLATVRADDLAAIPLRAVIERTGLAPEGIDDVILGCTNQAGEDNRNVARMALLLAGIPVTVPGQTVNRLCASGLQAVASAAQAIKAGEGRAFLAGGVESMTRAPFVQLKNPGAWDRRTPAMSDTTVGWRFVNPNLPGEWTVSLGETAEIVADKYGISREDQEAFALSSQARAQSAHERGVFAEEIVPVEVPQRKGDPLVFDRDEHPRPEVTAEKLARLKPIFRKEGTVTAGTSSGINDGSAALLVAGENMEGIGVTQKPLARIVGSAVAGVDPSCMGIGPVPAVRKVLERTGLSIDDVDLVELNEAFAAQALACVRELGMSLDRVNIYGGGIALGHPLGCTGAKLLVTLVKALHRENARYGMVTMCIGVGQGMAMVLEKV